MKKNWKRIFAIIGVILLLSLYVITFVTSLYSSPAYNGLFLASLLCTVFIPIFIWVFFWLVDITKGKHNNDNGGL